MSVPPESPDELIVPGWADAPVSGARVDLHEGPIIAGDPEGARVEVTETGVRAYDSTGTETASIAGEGGEFVGGEFRTSDQLPGQVTLSNTANQGTPGISVEPEDDTGYDVLPSIGPGPDHMRISGGVSTEGAMSGAQFSASGTNIYHNSPGETGAGSWVIVDEAEARLAYRPDRTSLNYESGVWVRPSNALVFSENEDGVGQIRASGNGATVSHDPSPGQGNRFSQVSTALATAMVSVSGEDEITRRLRVDESGVWVDVETGPHTHNYTSHNLLETAQDSGWQPITVGAGITASSDIAWRNKGGMIYFRGSVRASWSGEWDTVATLPPEARPDSTFVVLAATAGGGSRIRMTNAGALDIDAASAGELTFFLNPLSYPLG